VRDKSNIKRSRERESVLLIIFSCCRLCDSRVAHNNKRAALAFWERASESAAAATAVGCPSPALGFCGTAYLSCMQLASSWRCGRRLSSENSSSNQHAAGTATARQQFQLLSRGGPADSPLSTARAGCVRVSQGQHGNMATRRLGLEVWRTFGAAATVPPPLAKVSRPFAPCGHRRPRASRGLPRSEATLARGRRGPN
jgi:hypothetical protein